MPRHLTPILCLLLGTLSTFLFPAARAPATAPARKGMGIVYVLDATSRFKEHFPSVANEVRRSLSNLTPIQYAAVIVFNDTVTMFPAGGLTRATPDAKREIIQKLDDTKPAEHGTSPANLGDAMLQALDQDPGLIYLITTAGPNDSQIVEITNKNREQCTRIHAIHMIDSDTYYREQLTKLAELNHGKYKFVPLSQLRPRATQP